MSDKSIKIGKFTYITAIIILLLGFGLLILEKSQVTNFVVKPVEQKPNEVRSINDIDYSPADPTDNDEINDKKKSGQIDEEPTQPEPSKPINVVLTAATQDNPGGPVVVRVLLSDVSKGSCNIKISKEDVEKTYTNSVVSSGTYYNCEALDIPIEELSPGLWNLEVKVTSDERYGIATQSIEVKL